jgi:hypothetical protein
MRVPTRPNFDGEKLKLIGFGFEFSQILKVGIVAGNGDIDTHPESIPELTPLISN